ncbi:hypothetical protein AVEN_210201-1 [Araneus ventricosus]|uniref:Uncharacterized protein n=1 Tax=Araneus ventricosus TaxID=182803 RepID=A0A4Y2QM09_ARAVE|nr:hypothetical protein AVEN_250831-1 [Araneus ventricosus]GBN64634.1 hypothetical protein AVEN_210201-1 [Araneus ventricosus]
MKGIYLPHTNSISLKKRRKPVLVVIEKENNRILCNWDDSLCCFKSHNSLNSRTIKFPSCITGNLDEWCDFEVCSADEKGYRIIIFLHWEIPTITF